MRVFGNGVLTIKCGPNREVVAGDWRKIQNEDVYSLFSSRNNIKSIKRGEWDGRDM
jgi:hypothetical protein